MHIETSKPTTKYPTGPGDRAAEGDAAMGAWTAIKVLHQP